MPTQQTPVVRMYCLCGQKMRISETMYGRRARCVSCQLKIRLPRFEEVPRGATEIYLRDHPEFIREKPEAEEKETGSEKGAKKRRRRRISVPIDPSEPLRQLCSLDKKIKQELLKGNGSSRTELEQFGARLKEIRAALDDELHQRLMEAAIEMTATLEKLSELHLSARVGEIDYQDYREQANRLRWRREWLEKRQTNLRAWLAVRDPDLAGGYVELPLARMNAIVVRVPLAEEISEPPVLLGWMVEQLRAAFAERQQAEQSLGAISRMRQQGGVPEEEGKRSAKEQKAIRARATAAVRFWRDRLEQFKKDIDADQRVVEAQLDLARGRRQLGELGHDQFDALERELRRAKADLEKAHQTIERATSAPSDRDLPAMRGTFLKRLGVPSPPPRKRTGAVVAVLGLLLIAAITLAVVLGIRYGLPLLAGEQRGSIPSQTIQNQNVATEQGETGRSQPSPAQPQTEAPREPAAPPSAAGEGTVVAPPPPSEAASPEKVGETPVAPGEETSGTVPEGTAAGEAPAEEAVPADSKAIEVELRGVVITADKSPRFSLRIHTPDGGSLERVRELGGSVADGWIIREYNPDHQSITLFNGEDVLVVRRGEREPPPRATSGES